MKRLLVSVAALVLAVLASATAHAQCEFNDFSDAADFYSELVRSYAGCPSITFAAPNSSTGTGIPSCAPPFTHSPYLTRNKGSKCRFRIEAELESPCSDGSPGACTNLKIKANCRQILEPDGVTRIESTGWSLSTVSRATLDDRDNGGMTVIDFPLQISFPRARTGKLKVKTDSNTLLAGLGLAALPPCATIGIVSLTLQDPDGNPFAKLGVSGRPRGS